MGSIGNVVFWAILVVGIVAYFLMRGRHILAGEKLPRSAWDVVPFVLFLILGGKIYLDYRNAQDTLSNAQQNQQNRGNAIVRLWNSVKNGGVQFQPVRVGLNTLRTAKPAELESALGAEEYQAYTTKLAELDAWTAKMRAVKRELDAAKVKIDAEKAKLDAAIEAIDAAKEKLESMQKQR